MFHKNNNTFRPDKGEESIPPPDFRFCQIKEGISRPMFSSSEKMYGKKGLRAKRQHDYHHWSITDEDVPSLPFMYFLQPTHVIISTIKPSTIAFNIENCLKRLSITAEFDNERMIAHAQTYDQINFNIRLFSSKNKTNNQKTVVEINRLSSCQFGFHKIVCAILKSAEGKAFAIPDQENSRKRRKVTEELISLTSSETQSENAISALRRAETLLKKDRYDANALGMKSLLFLTNAQNVGEKLSLLVSKLILSEGSDILGSLQRKIFRLIAFGTINEDEASEIGCNQFSTTHQQQMRNDALSVLLQCFQTFTSNSSTTDFDKLCSKMWLEEEITSALLNDILKADLESHGSHIAYTALRVLHHLISKSSIASKHIYVSERNVEYILQKAIDVGLNRHELLAKEGKRFMSIFASR